MPRDGRNRSPMRLPAGLRKLPVRVFARLLKTSITCYEFKCYNREPGVIRHRDVGMVVTYESST